MPDAPKRRSRSNWRLWRQDPKSLQSATQDRRGAMGFALAQVEYGSLMSFREDTEAE
jgi:hypothetical protein